LEFAEVVRRRHMVRRYTDRAVPDDLLHRVLDAGLRAPSAGHTQGCELVVLRGAAETGAFWQAVRRSGAPPAGGRWEGLATAPVVIVPLSNRPAYLARYSEPDKAGLGLDDAAAWPMPYWDLDAAFAVMSMLLAATDAGLGCLFFALGHGLPVLAKELRIPQGRQPIGAITLGWPATGDTPSPSLRRVRRPATERVHFGAWSTAASSDRTTSEEFAEQPGPAPAASPRN
jgi:nitroreductase